MRKRILSFLIITAVLLGMVWTNVSASGYISENTQLDVLKALDIVKDYESENNAFEIMKKSTFINFLLNMTEGGRYTGTYDMSALEAAEAMEIIDSAAGVSASDTLKRDEAVKMAMCLLGYREICLNSGGYPLGYNKKANSVGLTTGLTLSDEVSNAEAYNLLFSAMSTGVAEVVSFSNVGNEYAEYENMTVLNLYRDIYEVNGVVTANRTSGLYDASAMGDGIVRIENDTYADPDNVLYDLLGYNVLAYAKKYQNDSYELIYGEIHENAEVTELDAEDVKYVPQDLSSIEYYTDEASGKTRTVAIPADVALLYNNTVCSDYTASDFMTGRGSVILIDNDGRDGIDVIRLNVYESMIVSSVSVSSNTITGEYIYEGSFNKLELDSYRGEGDSVRFFADGQPADITSIESGDVLSVMMSGNEAGRSITANIIKNSRTVDVTGYSETAKEITAGDVIIEVSDLYYEANSKGEIYAETISVGNRYKLYFDVAGKVIGARIENADSVEYGFLKETADNSMTFSDSLSLRIFTTNGEWENVDIAEKVRINGEPKAEISTVKDKIKAAVGGMIGYGTDNSGRIVRIELPVAYTDGISAERLNVTSEQTHGYRWNNTSFDSYYYMDGNTKVVVVPASEPDNEDAYDIGNNYYFTSDETVTYVGYECDEYNFLDIVLVKRDATESKKVGNSAYFVRDVSEVAHPEGGVTKQITVASSTYLGLSILAQESAVLDGVSVGDIVKIHVNAKGYIDNIEHVYKISDTDSDLSTPDYLHAYTTAKGKLLKRDSAGGRILLETVRATSEGVQTANKVALKVSATIPVLIYDAEREVVTAGSLADLSITDYVIASIEKSNVTGLFVIRYF